MSIRVLFFGVTADIVGEREIRWEAQGFTSKLLDRVIADHPRLASHKLLVSINEQYASGDSVINDGDVVAIFTAVSGG